MVAQDRVHQQFPGLFSPVVLVISVVSRLGPVISSASDSSTCARDSPIFPRKLMGCRKPKKDTSAGADLVKVVCMLPAVARDRRFSMNRLISIAGFNCISLRHWQISGDHTIIAKKLNVYVTFYREVNDMPI